MRWVMRIVCSAAAGVFASYGVAWWIDDGGPSEILVYTGPVDPTRVFPLAREDWPAGDGPTLPYNPGVSGLTGVERRGSQETAFWFIEDGQIRFWEIQEIRSGWPMVCVRRFVVDVRAFSELRFADPRPHPGVKAGGVVVGGRRLPVMPIWGGLAVNSAVWGCVVLAGLVAVPAGVKAIARERRKRRGTCVDCGYPSRGAGGVCSECGKEFEA